MDLLATYILSLLLVLAPVRGPQVFGGYTESAGDRLARYTEIAVDMSEVIQTTPRLPYQSPISMAQTAAQMVAIDWHESNFKYAVDRGLGKRGLGDHGHSFCLGQILIGKRKTREGWTGPELVADRKKCFRVQLRVMAGSIGSCRSMGPYAALSQYAVGHCEPDNVKSRIRVSTAHQLLGSRRPPKDAAAKASRQAQLAAMPSEEKAAEGQPVPASPPERAPEAAGPRPLPYPRRSPRTLVASP
jgi:hypothetical protein